MGHWINGSYTVSCNTEEPEKRLCAVNTGQGEVQVHSTVIAPYRPSG